MSLKGPFVKPDPEDGLTPEYRKLIARFDRDESPIQCPMCGSTQITANKKGFGVGKALTGAVVAGPVGLLGGFVGSRKVKITCLKCGHSWSPRP